MNKLEAIKWLAVVFLLSGTLASSLDHYPYNLILGGIGALLRLIAAIRVYDRPLITINGITLAIQVYGLGLYYVKHT